MYATIKISLCEQPKGGVVMEKVKVESLPGSFLNGLVLALVLGVITTFLFIGLGMGV